MVCLHFNMKNIQRKIVSFLSNTFILFCFYVYIFPFKAYGFEPRIIVFLAALIVYLFHPKNQRLVIYNFYVKLCVIPFLIGLLSIFTLVINGTNDFSFVIYPFQIIYLLLLSYSIFYLVKTLRHNIDFAIISKYIIYVLLIQSVIAFTMFFNPAFNDFIFDLQGIDTESRAIQLYLGKRLIGLGCFYFGGGLIYGFGLILVVLMLILNSTSKKKQIILILTYIIILITGIFIARTCLIGAGISLFLLLYNIFQIRIRRYIFKVCSFFIGTFAFIMILLVVLYNLSSTIRDDYGAIVDFGFEAFITFFEEGKLETASTEGLKTMYQWPDNSKTYIIGDGRFVGDDENSYYMGTDVGYLRLIYCFGIIGLLLIMLQQFYVLMKLRFFTENTYVKQMWFLIFIYILVLNVKGYLDFTPLLFIYLHNSYHNSISHA